MDSIEVKQLSAENERLHRELAEAEKHISILQNIRRKQSNRAKGLPSAKKNSGYRLVHFEDSVRYKPTNEKPKDDYFRIIIETPWAFDYPYETVKMLWHRDAEGVLATLGYTFYFPEGKENLQRDRCLLFTHPFIESSAFCEKFACRSDSYYTVSLYTGSAPKIAPAGNS